MKFRPALVFTLLVGLGTVQMAADVAGMPRLKAVAAATQVSPAMKVFTAHEGFETHAARFSLQWQEPGGGIHELPLTPAVYSHIRGPYNRRNVYGAALAYGPLLRANPATRQMHESVMRYAFCSPGVMRTELRIPAEVSSLRFRVTPVRPTPRSDLQLEWEVTCHA
jgi:hypothetical protein